MKVGDRIINMQNGYRGTVTIVYPPHGRPRHVQFKEEIPGTELYLLKYLPVSEVEKDPEYEVH